MFDSGEDFDMNVRRGIFRCGLLFLFLFGFLEASTLLQLFIGFKGGFTFSLASVWFIALVVPVDVDWDSPALDDGGHRCCPL